MDHTETFDRIIIGAGLYGLYAASFCAERGMKVLVLESDRAPFMRATYINQARVHMGYHYPRSLTTALKSASYFRRFCDDFSFCIHDKFDQIYATSEKFSWTSAEQFREFCSFANIKCEEIAPERYFKQGMCDGAFLTEEYTYDANILKGHYLDKLGSNSNASILYEVSVKEINKYTDEYAVILEDGRSFRTGFILNATYAGVNQIISMIGLSQDEQFDLKYELCEIILCRPSDELKDTGITVMDGPFFSIMPFGKTGYHSLTAVTFTPHVVSYDSTPVFGCQDGDYCNPERLGNCDLCANKPKSAWQYMSHLADKYLLPKYGYEYEKSLFSMKPILKSSEVDDSRPTAIKVHTKSPTFISVLSGKINTVYDLDGYLE